MPLFYKNPITGKREFLFTKCVLCGRKVKLKKENLGQNRFGDTFYYCHQCSKKNIALNCLHYSERKFSVGEIHYCYEFDKELVNERCKDCKRFKTKPCAHLRSERCYIQRYGLDCPFEEDEDYEDCDSYIPDSRPRSYFLIN